MSFNAQQVFAGSQLGTISGVASTLQGQSLGDERTYNNVKYRLFYNAGNSQINPGYGFCRAGTGAGPFSATISSTTEVAYNMAGCVVHATATTGTYFWGAVHGNVGSLVVSNVSIATGALVAPAANGVFTKLTAATAAVGQNMTSTATTDTKSGDFYVWFEGAPSI
jgi:hypothetical protein